MSTDRLKFIVSSYEKEFAERGGITPSDPLKFHLYHLARYWSRFAGFCRQDPSNIDAFINGDLGGCVQVGSEFAHQLIGPSEPVYERWQDYWQRTQTVLNKRPVNLNAVEDSIRSFNECLVAVNYDPWK